MGDVIGRVLSARLSRVGSDSASAQEHGSPAPQPRPVSLLSRASITSSHNEVESVFGMIVRDAPQGAAVRDLKATSEDLHFFLCYALGYGREEVALFVQRVSTNSDGMISFEEFRRGYGLLNITRVRRREHESFLRKPRSVDGRPFALEDLLACEVHVLDLVGACTIDNCRACEVVIGPSEASVVVCDCEDCTIY